jgi:hypothetical protein
LESDQLERGRRGMDGSRSGRYATGRTFRLATRGRGIIPGDAHDLPIRAAVAAPGAHPRRWLRRGEDRAPPGEADEAPRGHRGLAREPREFHAVHAVASRGLLGQPGGAALCHGASRPVAPTIELGGDGRCRADRPGCEAGAGDRRGRRPPSAQLRHPGHCPGRRDRHVRDQGHPRIRGGHEDAGRCVRAAQPDHRDARAGRSRAGRRRAARAAHLRRRWGGLQRRRDGGRGGGLRAAGPQAVLPEGPQRGAAVPYRRAQGPGPAGDAGRHGRVRGEEAAASRLRDPPGHRDEGGPRGRRRRRG